MERVLCGLVAALVFCLWAEAYTVPADTVVYITPTGEKYHREDCTYTNKATVKPLTIAAAEQRGYDACSRCAPDVKLGEYSSDWDGKSGESNDGSKASGSKTNTSGKTNTKKQATDFTEVLWAFAYILLFTPGGWLLLFWILEKLGKAFWWIRKKRMPLVCEGSDLPAEKVQDGVPSSLPPHQPEKTACEDISAFHMEQMALYANKSISQMAGVPDWVEMDEEGLPHIKGERGTVRDDFMVFTNNGTVYHVAACRYAGGQSLHAFTAKRQGMRPCSYCKPPQGTPRDWYYEWHRINRLRKEYGFDMLP